MPESALLPWLTNACLSKSQDVGNRTDGVLFSFLTPRSPGPAVPEDLGKKQNPVLNETAQPAVTQGQCTVSKANPAAEIQARIPESEQGSAERTWTQCSYI